MKRLFKIVLIVFFFNPSAILAQVGLNSDHLNVLPILSIDFNPFFFEASPSTSKMVTWSKFKFKAADLQKNSTLLVPKTYSVEELAFFCKVEVKLEKTVRFPVKFRLGDVNYVDQLEGK
jgi:hypothetical protein